MPVITKLAALVGRKVNGAKPVNALGKETLTKLIVKQDRRPDPPRKNPKGHVHVSSLVKGECIRFLSLQRRHNYFPDELANGATRIMWSIGRTAEHHVRSQLIAALPPYQVYGNWTCQCGKRTREGGSQDTDKCIHCGHFADIYKEIDLVNEDYGVTGHPDFILLIGGIMIPVEIKSITNSASANKKKEGFDTLEKPKADHCLQVSTYHRMLVPLSRKLGVPLGQQAVVIYVCKDFTGFTTPYPYKEFVINPFTYKQTIQVMFDDAKDALAGVRGPLPPRLNACSSSTTSCAASCPLVQHCFASTSKVVMRGNPIVQRQHLRE